MIENNDGNNITEPKSSQNEDGTDTNKSTDLQNSAETDVILPDIKDDIQNKEVVIDIDKGNVNIDKKYGYKEFAVYGYYGEENRHLNTTWVLFQGASAIPDGQEPLHYTPSRNDFVRLVLLIVLIMVVITASFVAVVFIVEPIRDIFVMFGLFIVIPALIVSIGMNYAMACLPCTRMYPMNILCLVIVTICMSIICAYITIRYETRIVLYAVLATSIVLVLCLLLACSSFDFTSYMIYIVVIAAAFGAVALVVMLGMLITGTYIKTLHLIILIVGTLINCIVFTMELQMILGGRAVEIGEDDYALAAFMIYTSIIDMFIKILQILGILDDF